MFASACDDDKKPAPAATPTVVASPPTPAGPLDADDFAALIDTRADLPANDPIDLALRYGVTPTRAPSAKPFTGEPAIGSARDFNVLLISGAVLSQDAPPPTSTVTATLRATSTHAYFYVDNTIDVSADAAQTAADAFESQVWPAVTGAFGEPPVGVDGDPRIIVLQADLGGAVGGYFSGDDTLLRAVRPLSNEAEMVYMDHTLRIGGAAFNVVLAHEFQHLLHQYNDGGEEAWVNEGLAEDASSLVGGALSTVNAFESRPKVQLNAWSSEGSAAHYGAGAAFFGYLAARLGGDAVYGGIARSERDGPAGIDEFLAAQGQGLTFESAFADWVVANILNLPEGPYGSGLREVEARVDSVLATGDPAEGAAMQFGTDYYSVTGLVAGDHTVRFDGAPQVSVLPVSPRSGESMMWANAGDDIDTTATAELDLAGAVDPLLTFSLWHDIERWFDWAYVSVSTDGGTTWESLPGSTTSADDPLGVAYGPGYTGRSGGGDEPAWVEERVSLARYVGQKVLLRFEYITDGGTHGEGFAIDDVAISGQPDGAAKVAEDSWDLDGWTLIDQQLQQRYIVRVIARDAAGAPFVSDVNVDADGNGELRFDATGLTDVVIAVAGATEGTRQESPYTLVIDSVP